MKCGMRKLICPNKMPLRTPRKGRILRFIHLFNRLSTFNLLIFNLLCVCVCVCVLMTHLYLTVCYPMDCSLPGSSVHGVLQARTGEGCHLLLQGIFLIQGSNPGYLMSPALQVDSLPLIHRGSSYHL